jgi:hypothetical protein
VLDCRKRRFFVKWPLNDFLRIENSRKRWARDVLSRGEDICTLHRVTAAARLLPTSLATTVVRPPEIPSTTPHKLFQHLALQNDQLSSIFSKPSSSGSPVGLFGLNPDRDGGLVLGRVRGANGSKRVVLRAWKARRSLWVGFLRP